MRNLRPCLSLAVAGALVAAHGCTDDGAVNADSSLRVINQTDTVIAELYLTDLGSHRWGPDLLRDSVLPPAEELELDVTCGRFDAKFVDEDGASCEIPNVDLCANDATWVIRENSCTVFAVARPPRPLAAAAPVARAMVPSKPKSAAGRDPDRARAIGDFPMPAHLMRSAGYPALRAVARG
jgi:hypothetical protein